MARVFYVHGSGHTADSFREQVQALPDSTALSLPGHPTGQALTSIEEFAEWLSTRIESEHGGKAVVAGNSLGGAIALQWALAHPNQAAGIVLIGSGARLRVSPEIFSMIDERWPACIQTLVDWSVSAGASAALRERAAGWHESVGQTTTRTDYSACDRFDAMQRLPELHVPTLIIVGSDDQMTPQKYSTFLHERIAGSKLAVIADAGHLVMAEKPAETAQSIADFLAALS